MKRIILAISLSAFSLTAFSVTDPWSVDIRKHEAVDRTYKQGESRDMRITLRDGTLPLDLTGASAVFYWYTNSVQNLWWTNSVSVTSPKAGILTAQWTPAMDVGAAAYPYWVGVWLPGSTCPVWRVNGTIRLLTSPGFKPNEQAVPVRTLDFSAIAVTNAPWLNVSAWQSGSNALSGALQTLSTNLSAQLTSASGAVAQASAASLSSYAATNRTVRIYNPTNSNEWTDGDGSKWRIAPPSHWVLTVPENNDVLSITNLPYPLTGPFTITLGSYTLYAQGGGGSLEMVLGYGGVKTWINSVNYSPTCPTNIALYAEENSTQDSNLKYVFGGTTSRVDTVVLLSDLAVTKELHADSYTNLIWRTVWSNGWCWVVAFTNTP